MSLRHVLTNSDIADLSARNQARACAAIGKMGKTWCCHPANRVQRITTAPKAGSVQPPLHFNCRSSAVWLAPVDPRVASK